jgi:hypothetical protein
MLRTVEIVQGRPVPDCSALDLDAANARKAIVQKRLGEVRGDDARTEEREALKAENFALERHIRGLREAKKREQMRRAFAGIGSPLHEALVEMSQGLGREFSPALVAELEKTALRKLAERERRAAERKAQKTA